MLYLRGLHCLSCFLVCVCVGISGVSIVEEDNRQSIKQHAPRPTGHDQAALVPFVTRKVVKRDGGGIREASKP